MNTANLLDPYWKMIELRQAFEAKRIVEYQKGITKLPLALHMTQDEEKIISKNPQRFPK